MLILAIAKLVSRIVSMTAFKNPEQDFALVNEAYHHEGIVKVAVGKAQDVVERLRERRFLAKVDTLVSCLPIAFQSSDGNVSVQKEEDRTKILVKQDRFYYTNGTVSRKTAIEVVQRNTKDPGVASINASREEWDKGMENAPHEISTFSYPSQDNPESVDGCLQASDIIESLKIADSAYYDMYSRRLGLRQ